MQLPDIHVISGNHIYSQYSFKFYATPEYPCDLREPHTFPNSHLNFM